MPRIAVADRADVLVSCTVDLAAGCGTVQCGHSQGGLHAQVHGVAHDPSGEGVLDRAQVELALGRGDAR